PQRWAMPTPREDAIMSSYTTYEDDATLTAYALGELEGEEAAEVEARLANDPEARMYVDQLRATAGTLTAAFKAEGASPAMAIEHAHRSRRGRWVVALAAAATFAAVGVTTYLVMEQTDDRRRLALGDEAAVDSQPMATSEPA